jgi:hypothetical protein
MSIAIVIALVGVLALVAGGAVGRDNDVKPPAPSQRPSAWPTARPPATSKPPLGYEAGVRIPLGTATGETRAVFVTDSTGMLVDAVSGRPREDVSVGARRVVVEQVDARTLRVIWADTAINDDVSLTVSRAGGTLRIDVVRRHGSPDVEIAHERVVLLMFDTGVAAAGVAATIKGSLDGD